ncbi:MAG: RnfH family protein [Pigmentiphaga sp.]|uniref:RnfH family protein n=1 Tax=Pigmentiphaga sp. TaxID=1977564 RepID=UPI0029B0B8F8|nr:RnfH family protein [Pigmentiphaga sp.]MDX3905617.1 RnfH family protein [Pigmentiphaga sp.]
MASGEGQAPGSVSVCVCYAAAGGVWMRDLVLPQGATLGEAIAASGFCREFPQLDPQQCGTGVYGRRRGSDYVLHDHDRVEIYRPLVFDPKESRRRRAEHKAATARAGRPAARGR